MWCSRCGRAAEGADRFCVGCGAPLDRPCPACGRATAPEATHCAACGAVMAAPGHPDRPDGPDHAAAPGHEVPFEARLAPTVGIDAYTTPRAAAPDRRVPSATPLIVRRRDGEWAEVWAEDGWTGWVVEAGLVDPLDPEGYHRPEPDEP